VQIAYVLGRTPAVRPLSYSDGRSETLHELNRRGAIATACLAILGL